MKTLLSALALVPALLGMAAPAHSAEAAGPLVLTSIQATYSIAVALTSGTGIRVGGFGSNLYTWNAPNQSGGDYLANDVELIARLALVRQEA